MSKTLPIIITFVIAVAGGFFTGMQYQKNKSGQAGDRQMFFGNFADMTQEQRQQMRSQFGGGQGSFGGGGRMMRIGEGSGIAVGEIIAQDEASFTVKLLEGGSKIVFYSTSTEVGRFDRGSLKELTVGTRVSISGTANDDGSLTAQNIQIRSAGFLPQESER